MKTDNIVLLPPLRLEDLVNQPGLGKFEGVFWDLR